MGATQSTTFDPDDRPPQPSLPEYLTSYFTTPRAGPTSHIHAVTSGRVAAIQATLAHRLPLELVQLVLEYAHVWESCRRECTKDLSVYATDTAGRGARGVDWGNGQEDEVPGLEVMDSPGRVWVLASGAVGCEHEARRARAKRAREEGGDSGEDEEVDKDGNRLQTTWVRALVVEMFSRDQGWVTDQRNYGTYNGSFSWFELSLVRDGEEIPSSRCSIQHNVVAGQYFKSHRVILDATHPLVRAARDGDRIVLWARAQYPGWANHVRRSAMTVYTAQYV